MDLRVAGAFHSPLMAEASESMDVLLSAARVDDPAIPMVGASDGEVLASAEEVRSALRKQMLSPVRWGAVIETFLSMGVSEIVESGQDGTLTRMLRDFRRKDITGLTAMEVLA